MDSKDGARDYVGIRKGLGGVSLGELEAQILDIVWNLEPPVSSTQVFRVMYPRRELSYSTIMLTMAKLARKGLLSQERTGPRKTDQFLYSPVVPRQIVAGALIATVCAKVLGVELTPENFKKIGEFVSSLCPYPGSDFVKYVESIGGFLDPDSAKP